VTDRRANHRALMELLEKKIVAGSNVLVLMGDRQGAW
jgi:hypothetical protein